MRRILSVVGFALLPFGAMAQEVTPFQGVIADQLTAFQSENVEQAWTYASPNIQGLFGNPGRFGTMVQQGYPMVWDNARVDFLESEEVAGAIYQKVRITDEAGQQHDLMYQMVEGSDGWRINGVQLLPKPNIGV